MIQIYFNQYLTFSNQDAPRTTFQNLTYEAIAN
jgi:hypothetical protein